MEEKYNPSKLISNAGMYIMPLLKKGLTMGFEDYDKVTVSVKNKVEGIWWKFGKNFPNEKNKLIENKDSLGEVVIEYNGKKIAKFHDYDIFWERVRR